eukprot:838096-Pyramimonas_sp.AAC.1
MSSSVGATRSLVASSMLIPDLGLKSLVLPPFSDDAPFFNFAPSLACVWSLSFPKRLARRRRHTDRGGVQ